MTQPQWENLASWVSIAVAAGVAILLLIGAWLRQEWPGRWLGAVERRFAAIAGRTVLWLIVLPALSFGLNIGIAIHRQSQGAAGIPRPLIHDEFSYLLAADTFAHGRLTNPTPQMWEAFETPQELMRPTYMSKYPPGQGIALAIGQIATGEPIVGVWLSTAAACAAIYWMLLGFVSPRWALVGGIVAVLCPELIDWSRVYWGGSVAVLGGAMLLGAWIRLMRGSGVGAAILLAVSLVVLANSRPYEGLVLSAALLLPLVFRAAKFPRLWLKAVIVPAAIVLVIALAGMGYYNFLITGSVLRLPFAEYAGQYDVYPKFWFLPTHAAPLYRNASLRWVHTIFEKGQYDSLRTPRGLLDISGQRLRELVWWMVKPAVLLVPLLFGLVCLNLRKPGGQGRGSELRWVCFAIGAVVLGLLAESFVLPHYAAPVLPAVLLLIVIGWKQLASWSRGAALAVGIGFLVGAGMIVGQPISRDSEIMGHAALLETPQLQMGRHLIFVRYAPGYVYHNEYVFNDADIPASRVVWARILWLVGRS